MREHLVSVGVGQHLGEPRKRGGVLKRELANGRRQTRALEVLPAHELAAALVDLDPGRSEFFSMFSPQVMHFARPVDAYWTQ